MRPVIISYTDINYLSNGNIRLHLTPITLCLSVEKGGTEEEITLCLTTWTWTGSYKQTFGITYAGFCYTKILANQRGLKSSANGSDWLKFQRSIIYAEKSFIGSGPDLIKDIFGVI